MLDVLKKDEKVEEDYKYEVAFSFVSGDEQVAMQLNDLLQERFTTFLYSERQKEIAGTDGEKTFSEIFGDEARLVVVLYRSGWGETSWTRIEETAIRNRAFEHGYDFTLFIPLDKPTVVPKWLPKTQLWIGLDRWGLNGAASVIEARILQIGGHVCIESIQEKALRIKRELDWDIGRKKILNSERGVNLAEEEIGKLQENVELQISSTDLKKLFGLEIFIEGFSTYIQSNSLGMALCWNNRYSNTLDEAMLEISIWPGSVPRPGMFFPFEQPRRIYSQSYKFDLDRSCVPIWKDPKRENGLKSEMLIEQVFGNFLNTIRERQMK